MLRFTIRLVVAVTTFLIGLTTTSLLTALPPAALSTPRVEQEVLAIEQQYKEAHLQRDTAALNRILADDFTLHYGSRFITKAERLALMSSPRFKFESISTRNIAVQGSEDRALMSGEAMVEGRYQGQEYSSPWYGFTRVYEKRQGQWQVVSVQVTHITRR